MIKNKFIASGLHLLLSLFLVSIIIGLVIFFWYPLDLIGITNFKDIVLLIISIDLVLGPLLTFVVFNNNKKSLKFDLVVIGAIQIGALAYGIYFLYLDHPVYVTYAKGSFNLVNAKYAKPENAKFKEYQVTKLSTANLAYSEIPTDVIEKNRLLDESMSGGPDLEERVDLYKPYQENLDSIIIDSLDIEDLLSDEKTKYKTGKFLQKHADKLKDYAFLPLEGSVKDAVIVIDKKSDSIITTIDIDPWQISKLESENEK